MRQTSVILMILLISLTACSYGGAVRSEDFSVKIDLIGKKIGAELMEFQQDTIQLQQKQITQEQMISRVEKRIPRLKQYQKELNSMNVPSVYQEAYSYMQSGMQKTINGFEMMHQGMITDDASQIQAILNSLTEAGQDFATVRTLMTPSTVSSPPIASSMSVQEYKTFVRSMDARINNAMNRVDNGIKQYREGTRTETEFISDIDYAISELEIVANSFTTARPPVELVTGHILAVEGATYMKEGFVLMKTAVKNKNNEAYKQAVQQFSTGLQKIQDANKEYKNKIQGGFVMTLGNI